MGTLPTLPPPRASQRIQQGGTSPPWPVPQPAALVPVATTKAKPRSEASLKDSPGVYVFTPPGRRQWPPASTPAPGPGLYPECTPSGVPSLCTSSETRLDCPAHRGRDTGMTQSGKQGPGVKENILDKAREKIFQHVQWNRSECPIRESPSQVLIEIIFRFQ